MFEQAFKNIDDIVLSEIDIDSSAISKTEKIQAKN